jgi:hypothetical protein
MKRLIMFTSIALFAVFGQSAAQCVNNRQNDELPGLLENKTVCANGVGAHAGDKWQELHQGTGSGPLIEYAKGPSDPVDQSHQVGTWEFLYNNNFNPPRPNRVRYDYGSGQIYTWRVYKNTDGTYSFCSNDPSPEEIAVATIQVVGPCP